MNSAPGWSVDELFPLLEELRGAGFTIGVEEILRALDAIEASRAVGSERDLRRLANYLGPVVCSNSEQQVDFHRRFENWRIQRGDREVKVGFVPPPPLRNREVFHELVVPTRRWMWLFGVGVVLVVVAMLAAQFRPIFQPASEAASPPFPFEATPPPPFFEVVSSAPPSESVPPQPLSSESAPPPFPPEISRIVGLVVDLKGRGIAGVRVGATLSDAEGRFEFQAPTGMIGLVVQHPDYHAPVPFTATDDLDTWRLIELAPRSVVWPLLQALAEHYSRIHIVSTVLPLILTFVWLAWRFYRSTAYRRRRRDVFLEKRLAPAEQAVTGIGLAEPRHGLYCGAGFARVAVEARRRFLAGPGDLDVDATLRRTVERLGFFTPVYRRRFELPVYLTLVDRAGLDDQQARRVDELLDHLAASGVELDRYHFDSDPRRCRLHRSGMLHGAGVVRDLQELSALHPRHRLLLFTDGAGLVHASTGRPARWLELFAVWPQRALLTPVPPRAWTRHEVDLKASFRVQPATPAGIAAFIAAIDGQEVEVGAIPGQPLPDLVAERPDRWLECQRPGSDEVAELVTELRAYLGPAGFRWLAALAVYPALDWYLTLYLGLRLQSPEGEAGHRLDEATLVSLLRLPWPRHGTMPDWLRLSLVRELKAAKKDEEEVRTFLYDLLKQRLEWPGSRFRLDVARREPETKWTKRDWRYLLIDLLRTGTGELEKKEVADRVFVDFLLRKDTAELQLRGPANWYRWIFEHGLQTLGPRPVAALSIGLLLGTAAFFAGWWAEEAGLREFLAEDLGTHFRSQVLKDKFQGAGVGEMEMVFRSLDDLAARGARPVVSRAWIEERQVLMLFEKGPAGVEEERLPAALLNVVEFVYPLANADDIRTLAVMLWALDRVVAEGTDDEGNSARALREELLQPLRQRFPPPPLLAAEDSDWADIPGGIFIMGQGTGYYSERPAHIVTVSPFRLLVHEVTVEEYRRLVPDHPGDTLHHPAVGVSWYAAYAYAAWLGGRLPTEAEWVYAARANCTFEYCDGEGREASIDDVAWYDSNSGPRLHEVCDLKKGRNSFGLCDMVGNAWEWVGDWYGPYSYKPAADPWGPSRGRERVIRGGSFGSGAVRARTAYRNWFAPEFGNRYRGFRVLLP